MWMCPQLSDLGSHAPDTVGSVSVKLLSVKATATLFVLSAGVTVAPFIGDVMTMAGVPPPPSPNSLAPLLLPEPLPLPLGELLLQAT